MANRIKPLRRVGSTGQPNIVNMQEGEIAVNAYDQKIWMRVGSNLVEIANAGGGSTWASISDKPETATRWPTWEEITGLSGRLMFSPPSMDTDVYAYPWGNVSTGETPSDFPYSSGVVISATLSHNRLLQFLSPSTGGSEFPDVFLRSWHSTSGGGGWTDMYRLLHTGDMDPLNVLTTNTNNIKTDSRLRFTYTSGVQLELLRTGGDGNSLMRFGAVGTDMYAGVGEPGSFAVGPDIDMTVAANRWFKVNDSGAFVHENEVFHSGNFDPEDYVATRGNQTLLLGNKTWYGVHTFNGYALNAGTMRLTKTGSINYIQSGASTADDSWAELRFGPYNSTDWRMRLTDAGDMEASGTISDATGDVRKLRFITSNEATALSASHLNGAVEKSNTSSYTYIFPSGLGSQGDTITFVNSGTSGDLTIARATGVALFRNGTNGNIVVGPGSMVTVYRSATANRWIAQ